MKKVIITLVGLGLLLALVWIASPFIDDVINRDQDPTDTYKWLSIDTPDGDAVEKYAVAHMKCLSDFETLYPRNWMVVWPSFPMRHKTMITVETILYGRYSVSISMEQDIRTDRKTLTAVPIGKMRLTVCEMLDLGFSRQAGANISYAQMHYFGPEDWARLLAAKGDLSSILSPVVKDHPHPQAEAYLNNMSGAD